MLYFLGSLRCIFLSSNFEYNGLACSYTRFIVSAHASSGCKMQKQKYNAHKRKLYSQRENIFKYKISLFNSTHTIHTSSLEPHTLLRILSVHCLQARLFCILSSFFLAVSAICLATHTFYLLF